jgi:hypothetical protein
MPTAGIFLFLMELLLHISKRKVKNKEILFQNQFIDDVLGAGVTRNVFPPYQPKLADPLISIDGRQRVPSTGGIFGCTDSSASSHDDSTLHESAASIKLNQIRRPNNNNNNGGGSATGPSQTSLVSKIPAPKSSAKSVPCHQENRV